MSILLHVDPHDSDSETDDVVLDIPEPIPDVPSKVEFRDTSKAEFGGGIKNSFGQIKCPGGGSSPFGKIKDTLGGFLHRSEPDGGSGGKEGGLGVSVGVGSGGGGSGGIAVPEVRLTHPPLLKGATMGYMKTIDRRGNTYMIRDSLASEDDPVESDGVDRMVTDLYNESMQMSSSANKKAEIFKYFYVLAAIFITIAGSVIGALTVQGSTDATTQYVAAVLGFAVAAIQALLSTFSLQNRSVLLKEVSNRLRKVARSLKTLQNSEVKPREKMKKLEEFYAEVDELDMNMFDNTITTISNPKPTTTTNSNESKHSGSDLSSNSDPLYDDHKANNASVNTNPEAMNRARQFINILQRRTRKSDDSPPSDEKN